LQIALEGTTSMHAPAHLLVVRLARVASVFVASATIVGSLWQAPTALAASRKQDKREIEARQAFAAGHYQDALDLFAALYAEKLHPTYLRNVGRCYQGLQQPDKAINAFRDYLRQAKDLLAAEKTEIDGYIAEMEALKKNQEAEKAPTPSPPPPVIPPPAPVAPAATEAASTRADLVQTAPAPTKPPAEPERFYKRGWFWGAVGGAVVGGVVGGLWAGGVFTKTTNHCPAGATCPP
jgi:hypothetical protein